MCLGNQMMLEAYVLATSAVREVFGKFERVMRSKLAKVLRASEVAQRGVIVGAVR